MITRSARAADPNAEPPTHRVAVVPRSRPADGPAAGPAEHGDRPCGWRRGRCRGWRFCGHYPSPGRGAAAPPGACRSARTRSGPTTADAPRRPALRRQQPAPSVPSAPRPALTRAVPPGPLGSTSGRRRPDRLRSGRLRPGPPRPGLVRPSRARPGPFRASPFAPGDATARVPARNGRPGPASEGATSAIPVVAPASAVQSDPGRPGNRPGPGRRGPTGGTAAACGPHDRSGPARRSGSGDARVRPRDRPGPGPPGEPGGRRRDGAGPGRPRAAVRHPRIPLRRHPDRYTDHARAAGAGPRSELAPRRAVLVRRRARGAEADPARHPREPPPRAHPDAPRRSTTAPRCSLPRRCCARSTTLGGRGSRPPGSAPATGSASGSRPAPPTCTWRSSRCWRPAPPTSRSTPTTPTSAPTWSSARPTVCAVIGAERAVDAGGRRRRGGTGRPPGPDDDAWIIFTSGSTGKPEGRRGHPPQRRRVRRRRGAAVPAATSRSAPATGCSPGCPSPSTPPARRCGWPGGTAPAWCPRRARSSAPAPTSAPGSSSSRITVVSTVPTLAALWPAEPLRRRPAADLRRRGLPAGARASGSPRVPRGLEHLRPHRDHRRRLRRAAARRRPGAHRPAARRLAPRRRRPRAGEPVAMGEVGELVIAGVGPARYLDAEKDAEKFAPLPALGWDRAYRSGDLVRADPEGLRFVGRADTQVKIRGFRIELVGDRGRAAAAARRRAGGGEHVRVGARPHRAGRLLQPASRARRVDAEGIRARCAAGCPATWCRGTSRSSPRSR